MLSHKRIKFKYRMSDAIIKLLTGQAAASKGLVGQNIQDIFSQRKIPKRILGRSSLYLSFFLDHFNGIVLGQQMSVLSNFNQDLLATQGVVCMLLWG